MRCVLSWWLAAWRYCRMAWNISDRSCSASSLIRQMSSQIACSRLTSPRYDWMAGATAIGLSWRRISSVESKWCLQIVRAGMSCGITKLRTCQTHKHSSQACVKYRPWKRMGHSSDLTFLKLLTSLQPCLDLISWLITINLYVFLWQLREMTQN